MIILWLVLGVVVWFLFEVMLAVVSYSQLDEPEDVGNIGRKHWSFGSHDW